MVADHRTQSQQTCPSSLRSQLESLGVRVCRLGKYYKKGNWTYLEAANPSAAFCISQDGYYLTAAHCVPAEIGEFVALWTPSHDLNHPVFARIVWKPSRQNEPDLAILKGTRHSPSFSLADPSSLKPEMAVAHLGFAWCHSALKGKPWFAFGRGRIQEITPPTERRVGSRVFHLKHDSPCWFGDSGGPLLTENGQVAGVITGAQWRVFPPRRRATGPLWCSAVLPDPQWLQAVLDEDRKRAPLP